MDGHNDNHSAAPTAPQSQAKWQVLPLLLIVLAGITGNLLVCIAIYKEKKLQNITNYFLMSLSVADLFVSCIVMPLGMMNEFMGYWPLGLIMCDLWQVMDVMMCTSSIMHMCIISMDRYMAIRNPLKTRNKSRTSVGIKITIVWLISLVTASPLIILCIIHPRDILNLEYQCGIFNHHFLIFGSLTAFFIPLTIMAVAYTLTIKLLEKQASTSAKSDKSNCEGIRRSFSSRANIKKKLFTKNPVPVLRKISDCYVDPKLNGYKHGYNGSSSSSTHNKKNSMEYLNIKKNADPSEIEPLNALSEPERKCSNISDETMMSTLTCIPSPRHSISRDHVTDIPTYHHLHWTKQPPPTPQPAPPNASTAATEYRSNTLSPETSISPDATHNHHSSAAFLSAKYCLLQQQNKHLHHLISSSSSSSTTETTAAVQYNANKQTPSSLKEEETNPDYNGLGEMEIVVPNTRSDILSEITLNSDSPGIDDLYDHFSHDSTSPVLETPRCTSPLCVKTSSVRSIDSISSITDHGNSSITSHTEISNKTPARSQSQEETEDQELSLFVRSARNSFRRHSHEPTTDTKSKTTDEVTVCRSNTYLLPLAAAAGQGTSGSSAQAHPLPLIDQTKSSHDPLKQIKLPSNQSKFMSENNILAETNKSGGPRNSIYGRGYNRLRLSLVSLRNRALYDHSSNESVIQLHVPSCMNYSRTSETTGSNTVLQKALRKLSWGVLARGRGDNSEACSDQEVQENHPPNMRFRELMQKHRAAFKMAGILMAKREEKNHVRTERKAIKVLGTMFVIFVICWAPFFSTNFTMGVCPSCNIDIFVFKLFLWLGYVGSILNPIIYTVFNKTFRRAFISILTCRLGEENTNVEVKTPFTNNNRTQNGKGNKSETLTTFSTSNAKYRDIPTTNLQSVYNEMDETHL